MALMPSWFSAVSDDRYRQFSDSYRTRFGERPYRVKFSPDGKQVLFTMPNTKEIIVYDRAARKETRRR